MPIYWLLDLLMEISATLSPRHAIGAGAMMQETPGCEDILAAYAKCSKVYIMRAPALDIASRHYSFSRLALSRTNTFPICQYLLISAY